MSFAGKQGIKGALCTLKSNSNDLGEPFLVFQYNPELLARTIAFQNQEETSNGYSKIDNTTPIHFINLTLFLDFSEQIQNEEKNRISNENGLHASLVALESMMEPQTEESKQMEQSTLFFIWGPNRIMPVRLDSLKIIEEAFDTNLNPMKAKIDLCMRVLNRSELKKRPMTYNILCQKSTLGELYEKFYSTISKKVTTKSIKKLKNKPKQSERNNRKQATI